MMLEPDPSSGAWVTAYTTRLPELMPEEASCPTSDPHDGELGISFRACARARSEGV